MSMIIEAVEEDSEKGSSCCFGQQSIISNSKKHSYIFIYEYEVDKTNKKMII